MKKIAVGVLTISLMAGSTLFAHGETVSGNSNSHMGDHMHEGKMTNHINKNGMANSQISSSN